MLPKKTAIQSLLFSRKPVGSVGSWTVKTAKAWAKKHDKKYGNVDVTDDYIHLRQREPEEFQFLRTIEFGKGIKAHVGRPWVEIIDNPHEEPKHNARVLVNIINNDYDLHKQKHKLYERFSRQKSQKKFDKDKAIKSLRYLIQAAMRRYSRLKKIPKKAKTFSLNDLTEAVELLIVEFDHEWHSGLFDYMVPRGKWTTYRRQHRRSV